MLVNDLTSEQQKMILAYFNNSCALTGDSENIHLDHVIPIASKRGGTTYGNIIPLRGDLNSSKQDKNLFEWFSENEERLNLSRDRFNLLINYLAKTNEMTVDEYKKHYYSCFNKAD